MPQDNCRCIMAGDSYSFIITDFQERNVGRYSITAENHHGKATCSAKVLFEGWYFYFGVHVFLFLLIVSIKFNQKNQELISVNT
jgi:hypothetical protein